MATHENICNHCGNGNAMACGVEFRADGGFVYQQYRCTNCGRSFERQVPYSGFDIEHPKAHFALLPTPDYLRRIGLA